MTEAVFQGFINVEAELAKAEKKMTAAQAGVERLNKIIQKPETPADIKGLSAEQVRFKQSLCYKRGIC